MIVKVQWPLYSNEPMPRVLVYNEDRSVYFTMPAEDWQDILGPDNPKMYFEAEIEGTHCRIDSSAPVFDAVW